MTTETKVEAMLSAMDMCLMAGPADAYRAMLAAAPAASGGEDGNG